MNADRAVFSTHTLQRNKRFALWAPVTVKSPVLPCVATEMAGIAQAVLNTMSCNAHNSHTGIRP